MIFFVLLTNLILSIVALTFTYGVAFALAYLILLAGNT